MLKLIQIESGNETKMTTLGSRFRYSMDNETPLSDSLSVQNLSVQCTDNEARGINQ